MDYIKDETLFLHKVWGIGTFRGQGEGGILQVEFTGEGIKKFVASSVENGILQLVSTSSEAVQVRNQQQDNMPMMYHNGDALRQYDSSTLIVAEKNILEAFDCEDVVIFNESYVIIGEEAHAHKISATYDLTVIGDISADEIHVNGNLTVTGSIAAKQLHCSNTLVCHGDVVSDSIYVGADIIATSVKCTEFACDGNAIIRTTIDIDKSSRTEKTMIACEGIIGAGEFAARNAIANEYFEFDGAIQGHILELETDTLLSEVDSQSTVVTDLMSLPVGEAIEKLEHRLVAEYSQFDSLEEDALIEFTKRLANGALSILPSMGELFDKLIQLSYKDEIDDLCDYLVVMYAKRVLPKQLYHYETIEHIDKLLLPKAEENIDTLDFVPSSISRLVLALHIVEQLREDLPLSTDEILDKIFSSIGLRYATVKGIMTRASKDDSQQNRPSKAIITETVAQDLPEDDRSASSGDVHVEAKVNPQLHRQSGESKKSKENFLSTPLSVTGKGFGMTKDEVIRLASVKIKTTSDFLQIDESFIHGMYKKKPFLALHLIATHQRMKQAAERME